MVSEKLAEAHGKTWSTDDITSKIKLLAERKSHLEPNFKEPASQEAVDIFENDTEDRMWRWEVISIDILPSNVVSKIRKARSARNKLRQHQAATLRLVASVQKAIPLIRDPSCPKNKLDTAVAKLSKDEEKVLKYEREAEKQKLAKQAKRQKELEAEAKRLEKEEAAEEKRREKERKQQEAEQKKLEHERQKKEAAEAREEAKKKKAQLQKEKEEQQKAAEKRKEESLKKQASCLMSFFGACKSSSPKKRVEDTDMAGATSVAEAKTDTSSSDGDFDAEKFRSSINSKEKHDSGPIFGKLSPQAIASRKRRTRQVSVSVYVTVMPDNAFDAQPFAEQQIIQIPNKYRFLSFHEDCRPAYHGTWSKKSSIVSGRNPLGKDTDVLDYEYDSEFEWEEGDDDIGEDVNDDGKDQEEDMDDEEGDIKNYNYQDGWMVDDDDLLEGNEDMDEETRELYKKKLLSGQARSDMLTPNTVCVVAPVMGGIPVEDFQSGISSGVVEGFSAKEAEGVVASHAAIRLHKDDLYLDAFPPPLVVEESNAGGEAAPSSADGSKNSLGKDEYSPEDMETLVRFAHHCTLNSKEKLIEELRTANPSRFESRAKAIRKLDSIAVKQKRRNTTGYFWEVKKDILEELGLTDLLAMKMEGEDKESAEEKAAASKKKKDTTTGAKSTKKRKSNSGDNAKKPATKKAKVETSTDTSARAEQESTKKSTGTGSNSLAKNATPSKKRAAPAGSVNLMESFVKKLKPTPVKTSEEARLNSEASTEAREKESGPSEAVETQSS
jgi:chromatin assembly factor 1 subunit A